MLGHLGLAEDGEAASRFNPDGCFSLLRSGRLTSTTACGINALTGPGPAYASQL
jgi:hypothetical protein